MAMYVFRKMRRAGARSLENCALCANVLGWVTMDDKVGDAKGGRFNQATYNTYLPQSVKGSIHVKHFSSYISMLPGRLLTGDAAEDKVDCHTYSFSKNFARHHHRSFAPL